MLEEIRGEGGLPGPDVADHDEARLRRIGPPQRDIAVRLGIRAEVASSIETERAKYLEARDAYEALLSRIEEGTIRD